MNQWHEWMCVCVCVCVCVWERVGGCVRQRWGQSKDTLLWQPGSSTHPFPLRLFPFLSFSFTHKHTHAGVWILSDYAWHTEIERLKLHARWGFDTELHTGHVASSCGWYRCGWGHPQCAYVVLPWRNIMSSLSLQLYWHTHTHTHTHTLPLSIHFIVIQWGSNVLIVAAGRYYTKLWSYM